jgi:hypothetical protein
MNILEDNPILPVVVNPFLVLVGFAVCFEIEDISAILLQGKNLDNGGTVPLDR